ncbi:MAG: RNA methyltransferase [Holophagaceae bacterium]
MDALADPRLQPYQDLRAAGPREVPGQGACFLCEGRLLVEQALAGAAAGRLRLVSVLATPAAAEGLAERLPAGADLVRMEPSALSALVGFEFHRGLLACVAVPPEPPERKLRLCRRLLVLPRLQDAENLGLLVRSAAALGMDGVLAGPGPDLWSRRTVRVSMGAAWKVPVWQKADPAEWVEAWREEPGSEVVAAHPGAGSVAVRDWVPSPRVALVLGQEGPGLDEAWLARCDRRVRIPMRGGVDSLNVAAAGAILMHELGRREA